MIDDADRDEILRYEDIMAEVGKRRNPPSHKGWWESPGVLTSATAVLTVALTSMLAYCTQLSLKDRDFATQQAKSNYESEIAAVQDAFLLANETLHWAGERDRLLRGDYVTLPFEIKKRFEDSVNSSDLRWRQGRSARRVALDLLFHEQPEVLHDWDNTVARLNEYTSCTVAKSGCAALRPSAESAIVRFRDSSVVYVIASRPSSRRR